MPFRVILLTDETNFLVARAKTLPQIKEHFTWISENLLAPVEGLEGEEAIQFLRLKFESLAQTEVILPSHLQSEDFKKETVASGGSTMLPDVPDPLKLKAELEKEEKAEKGELAKPDTKAEPVPQVKITAEEESPVTEAKKKGSKSSEGGKSGKKKDSSKSGSEKSGEKSGDKPGLLGLLEDFNRKSQTYDPILLEAVKANDVAKVKKLFADPYPPDVDVRDTNGRTEICSILLSQNADPRATSLTKMTPLHYIVKTRPPPNQDEEYAKVLNQLVEKGTPNAQNAEGETPLHKAVLAGNQVAVNILLAHGPSVINAALENNNKATALDLAKKQGDRAVIDAIQQLFDAAAAEFPNSTGMMLSAIGTFAQGTIRQSSSEEKKKGKDKASLRSKIKKGSVRQRKKDNRRMRPEGGVGSEQGRRKTMEDAHVLIDDLTCLENFPILDPGDVTYAYYGVYDGHGGEYAAKLASKFLHKNIIHEDAFVDDFDAHYHEALTSGFQNGDIEIIAKLNEADDTSGTTVVAGLIIGETLYVGNLGDSELIVVAEEKKIVTHQLLTEKHNPGIPAEAERIKKAGGIIVGGRLFATLAVSRSLGDKQYKVDTKFVSNQPSTASLQLRPKIDKFMILACDGLWDVMKYQEAAEFAWERLNKGNSPESVAQELAQYAYDHRSQDNITVMVVNFKWN